jgi:hypothetical protein
VPTPFYHLSIANDLLRHPQINLTVRQLLTHHRCAFMFGNTAPDVQVVSGDTREETHFFMLPFQPHAQSAWNNFLEAYPALNTIDTLQPEQAAFIAGYLCHLQADWYWVKEIFAPIFGPDGNWGTFQERIYLHNVLRSYLDRQALEELPEDTGRCLDQVHPVGWLPFVSDRYFVEWRNYLSRQLKPGALAETVQVFAERQGLPAEDFSQLLDSPERMDKEVFNHIPLEYHRIFRQNLLIENLQLIQAYFNQSQ